MEKKSSKLFLDGVELWTLLGFVLVLCGMTFTLGVLVGYGVSPPVDSHGVASLEHGKTASSTKHGESKSAERAPASAERKAPETPGADLKKSFQQSKQKALADWSLRAQEDNKPKSVADASAYFEKHKEWNRKPAMAKRDWEHELEQARNSESKREKKGVPGEVNDLFERRPGSVNDFRPTPLSYTLQISSYATIDEAQARVTGLRSSNVNDAYFEIQRTSGGEKWYRVGVGSYPTLKWANKMGDQLVQRKLVSDYVVRKVQ